MWCRTQKNILRSVVFLDYVYHMMCSNSIYSSRVALFTTASSCLFWCLAIMTIYFKRSWLWRQNARERDSAISLRVRAERKKMSRLKGLKYSGKILRILVKSCFESCQDLEIPWLHTFSGFCRFLRRKWRILPGSLSDLTKIWLENINNFP